MLTSLGLGPGSLLPCKAWVVCRLRFAVFCRISDFYLIELSYLHACGEAKEATNPKGAAPVRLRVETCPVVHTIVLRSTSKNTNGCCRLHEFLAPASHSMPRRDKSFPSCQRPSCLGVAVQVSAGLRGPGLASRVANIYKTGTSRQHWRRIRCRNNAAMARRRQAAVFILTSTEPSQRPKTDRQDAQRTRKPRRQGEPRSRRHMLLLKKQIQPELLSSQRGTRAAV